MSTIAVTRSERRAAKRADPNQLPFGTLLAWAGAGLVAAANFIILSYFAIYCTDTLGLSPVMTGTIILVSNVAHAVAGFLVAWIVDRSPETRWGKARPYEFAIIGWWLFTILLFATPAGLGTTGRTIWVFVFFFLIKIVWDPMYNSSGVLYMARAFSNRTVYAKVLTRSGIITSIGAIAVSTALPVMLNAAGKSTQGWMQTIAILSVVLATLGMSRFVFIKEKYKVQIYATKVRFGEIIAMVRNNPWIWVLALMQFAAAGITGANVASYYFRYIVGNLGLAGIMSGLGIVLLPLLLVIPRLMRRFPISRIIMVASFVGMAGAAVNFVAGKSLVLLVIGGLLQSIALLPISYLISVLILDLCTYNEWKGHRRLESTLGATVAIFNNVGAGVAGALVGAVMARTGYNGAQTTQSGSALIGIRALYSVLPFVLLLVVAFSMWLYHRFDSKLPEYQREVEARRAASGEGVAEASMADTNADGILEPEEVPVPTLVIGASNALGDPTPVTDGIAVVSDPKTDDSKGSGA